ncbi:MAG TPA: N-acetylmuramic acid 6-phosphate etherase, partial [Dielma fastidiosa]|nr:N-acetylmuramic acid 6-phosphate etherase [Dielma fastidiosa]
MMKIQLDKLMTEQQNPDTMSIDRMNSFEIVKAINNEDKKIALAVEKELASIAELVDACAERLSKGGRILYTGAGTSGRLGILDASECPPTYGVSDQLVQGLIAGGLEAIFKSKENAEDDREAGIEDLKSINLCEKDVVIGLAASGRTPYVAAGLEYANSINAYTGSISCVKNSEIGKIAKTAIDVETGPEVVTGSTRMKAGTAQKMVLNMISTGT